jgi:hypothetical protein
VLNTGHQKSRITVLLTARNDGQKLKPFVLLPRKRQIPDIVKKFGHKMQLSWVGKTWMDDTTTCEYLEKVIKLNYKTIILL